ncbi:MAG: tRNA lysidine(34) synthetase TilS [Bacteroidota bacterium]
MIADFISFNTSSLADKKTLLAVSGGLDSITMTHLFRQAKWTFGIAHCNFQLRGEDSDGDARFVKQLAEECQVPYFETSFDTAQQSSSRKQSTQLAARELRYQWLEDIRHTQHYDYIATAHHLNDSIETLLFNFTKGCGLRGLHGILHLQNKLVRPLLFCGRAEIESYARYTKIQHREDASNASDQYTRNQLRHQVVPQLQQINPALELTARQTFQRIQEAEYLYDHALADWKSRLLEERGKDIRIDWPAIFQHPVRNTLLYEFLSPFGFNNSQIQQLLQHQPGESGPLFLSSTHRLLLNRQDILVEALPAEDLASQQTTIKANDTEVMLADGDRLKLHKSTPPTSFAGLQQEAWLDLDRLSFPLQARRWQAHDQFQPLGMKGKHQKIQDLFTNEKLSRLEKEKAWLLTDASGAICWVVGLRTDDRFKIRKDTKQALHIRWFPQDTF